MSDIEELVPEVVEFKRELNALHEALGKPIFSDLAQRAGMSDSYVHALIRGKSIGNWEKVAAVVRAMHGNLDHFYLLWLAAMKTRKDSPTNVGLLLQITRVQEEILTQNRLIFAKLAEILQRLEKQ